MSYGTKDLRFFSLVHLLHHMKQITSSIFLEIYLAVKRIPRVQFIAKEVENAQSIIIRNLHTRQ